MEKYLRQKLCCKKYNSCRYEGLIEQQKEFGRPRKVGLLYQELQNAISHKNPIDNQGNIVAHKHGGNKARRIFGEQF